MEELILSFFRLNTKKKMTCCSCEALCSNHSIVSSGPTLISLLWYTILATYLMPLFWHASEVVICVVIDFSEILFSSLPFTSGCLYLLFPRYGFLFSVSLAFPLNICALGFLPCSGWCAPLLLSLHNSKFCVLTLSNYCRCESGLLASDPLINETPAI